MPQLTLVFLAFVAVAVTLFWLAPRRFRPALLTFESALFLAWLDFVSLLFLVAVGSALYFASRPGRRTTLIDWGIVALVALFFAVRLAQIADELFGLPRLVAPAGFAFALLRLLHYRIEARRGTLAPHDLHTFLRYLLFFPTITVGPIHRCDDFLRSEARHRWDADRTGRGLSRVLIGYVKVVVIANWAVYNQDLFLAGGPANPLAAWLFESLQYGLYLYFAFAGYSDIAIGIALVLGYAIVENFRWPFLQPNLGAFWRSWHMSLSDWCRRYIFLPALARWRHPVPALFAAMIALGLWHELSLRFLAWGAWHAAGLALWRAWQKRVAPRLPRPRGALPRALVYSGSVALTLAYVFLGFTLIKEPSLSALWDQLIELTSPPPS